MSTKKRILYISQEVTPFLKASEISSNVSDSMSKELTDILLEGDHVDIEIGDKSSGSALRSLRKLSIDYEVIA